MKPAAAAVSSEITAAPASLPPGTNVPGSPEAVKKKKGWLSADFLVRAGVTLTLVGAYYGFRRPLLEAILPDAPPSLAHAAPALLRYLTIQAAKAEAA